jgi:RluA family pseudouridine synthase
MKNAFEILYEDEEVVVVNKSPFMLTIPDRYSPEKPNLYHWLQKHYGKIFIVHRLDKETSGILVFAKTEEAHKNLSRQFEEREVDKNYLVLVEGRVHQQAGIIDMPIAPHPGHPEKMIVSPAGKPSITHYKVLELFKNFSLLEANIKTGRTHQIRVHFQAIGYPLAVDSLYGKKAAFYLSDVKLKKFKLGKNQEEQPLMARTSLHAWRLTFRHPETDLPAFYEAPMPKDFGAVLQQLRKWGMQ